MFYIGKLSRLSKRDIALMHVLPAVIVFLAFSSITIWNWIQLKQNLENTRQTLLAQNMKAVADNTSTSLASYEDILKAGVGLFDASDYVSRLEWRKFVSNFGLEKRYPAVSSIGFIKSVSHSDLDHYTRTIRSNEKIPFHPRPKGERPTYAPIVYAEPSNNKNAGLRGYDMYSNRQLKSAMEKARDSGNPAVTSRIIPRKGSPFGNQPEIFIFVPIYLKKTSNHDVSGRQKHIWGYIYAKVMSYRMADQFSSLYNQNFGFQIHDASNKNAGLLYQTPNYIIIKEGGLTRSLHQQLSVSGRTWQISGLLSPFAIPATDRSRPSGALWGGLFFSAFLAVFIYTLLINRSRALKERDELQIQSAKDELLALASHQLRTPATGVKQYIGMLLEGYAGSLSKEQKELLKEAYTSNERQLGTINDMLFVARSEQGDITYDFQRINLVELISQILSEQRHIIKESGHRLVSKLPDKPIFAQVDTRYLRMAVENLLNNSVKYTRPGGTITLSLKKTKINALISVEDTGVGVNERYRHLLFRKFSRIPNALTSQVSGTGIGLYLAKKVAKAHDGKIQFRSATDDGSICTISLPLRRQSEKKSKSV